MPWRNKYKAFTQLYSQLRTEHFDMLSKHKQLTLKTNSAQEVIDRMECMEKDIKAKNLKLADMIGECNRARFDLDWLPLRVLMDSRGMTRTTMAMMMMTAGMIAGLRSLSGNVGVRLRMDIRDGDLLIYLRLLVLRRLSIDVTW